MYVLRLTSVAAQSRWSRNTVSFKGIVHLKMKMSSFTHTHVVTTCIHFFVMMNTKEDILSNVSGQTVCEPHSRKKEYYGSEWGSQQV